MEDVKFIEQVKRELQDIKSNYTVNDAGDQFAIWFGSTILDLEPDDVAEEFHIGGAGDDKIDLGIIAPELETKIVVQCKYTGKPTTTKYNKNLIDEVLAARSRIEDSPTTGNDKRREFVEKFRRSSKSEKLIAVGFGGIASGTMEYARAKNVDLYDLTRIKREYLLLRNPAGVRPPQSVVLRVPEDRIFEYREGAARAYVVTVPAQELHKLLTERQIGAGIFQENLRFKLREQKSSNRIADAIQRTVIDMPENLLILNNGITFVCDEAKLSKAGASRSFVLTRPQIVNGCQTAHAVYDALDKMDATDGEHAYVLAKIVVLERASSLKIEDITESTNSQNRITERDQYANDSLQLEIKNAFMSHKPEVFYDCKSGEWELTKSQNKAARFRQRAGGVYRRIKNEDCARLYLALAGMPAEAKNVSQSTLFTDDKYLSAIFDHRKAADERFKPLLPEVADHRLRSGLDEFVSDVLFAFAVKRLSLAAEILYKRKLALCERNGDVEVLGFLKERDFFKYWDLHVVRLMHYLVERRARGDAEQREQLRCALVGDAAEIGYAFESLPKIAERLPFDDSPESSTLMPLDALDRPHGLFSCWFERLTEKAVEVRNEAFPNFQPWSAINHFAKRLQTANELKQKVSRVLAGPDAMAIFPAPETDKPASRRNSSRRVIKSARASARV